MRKVVIIVLANLLFACNQQQDLIQEQFWIPTKINSQLTSPSSGLTALHFGNDSLLKFRTLGTPISDSSLYILEADQIRLVTKHDTINWTILELTNTELTIQFDSATTISYTNQIDTNPTNLSELLKKNLTSHSWLMDSTLIEFHDSLSEDSPIGYAFRNYVNDLIFHEKTDSYFHYHEPAVWGANYFKGINFLSFGNTFGNRGNRYFIVESVNDSLISGFRFNYLGEKEHIQMKAIPNNSKLSDKLIGKWNLKSFEEIPNEFNGLNGTFEEEKGVVMSDFENLSLSYEFDTSRNFTFSANNEVISKGFWNVDPTGQIVRLSAEQIHDDSTKFYRTSYLSIISLNDSILTVFKEENLKTSKFEFEQIDFIEQFEKVKRW